MPQWDSRLYRFAGYTFLRVGTYTVDTYTRASLGLIQPSLSVDSFHQSAVYVLLAAPSVDVAFVVPDPVLLAEPFAFKLCG